MAFRKQMPTQEYLRQCFRFEDGCLYWIARPRSHFKTYAPWLGSLKRAGDKAGTVNAEGYLVVHVSKSVFYVHRIVWKMHHGTEPEIIDHIDRNRSNNQLDNLRESNQSQSLFNRGIMKNNKSGYKGVCQYKNSGKWRAIIGDNGKARQIGYFDTREEAAEAYFTEAQRIAGVFATRG